MKWNSAQPDPAFHYRGAGTLIPMAHNLPVSVVVYVVTRSTSTRDGSVKGDSLNMKSEEILKTLQLFSEMLATDVIPDGTKSRITLQVITLHLMGFGV